MHIVVLIKQVPATDNVKIDPERGTMVRNNVKSELNPLDLYAVEEAVRIKERLNRLRSPFRSAEYFDIEEIIDPRDTRALLTRWVKLARRALTTEPARFWYRP